MKKIYATPMTEVIVIEVERGFYVSQQKPTEWGYVDNFSPIDRLTDDENVNADINANHFKISNAIDASGAPKQLDYIDFIKVQVGLNSKSGWLGEVSTEVCGFYDYRLKSER